MTTYVYVVSDDGGEILAVHGSVSRAKHAWKGDRNLWECLTPRKLWVRLDGRRDIFIERHRMQS